MKLRISYSLFLFILTTTAFASNAPIIPSTVSASGKLYVGIFGGSGASSKFNTSQLGTAFYTEAAGGPLSVNAFGQLSSQSAPFFGAQIGYQAPDIFLNAHPQWTLRPAAELEGYEIGDRTFSGNLVNNTVRLPEHDFIISYPMSRTIFLVNAVLNFNHPVLWVHPYIGLGIGDAILRISGANSTQVNPIEEGINHFNASTSDTNSTFAGQIKLGLSYDINQYVSVFADYRWLYLASSHFVFGSTVYPTHVETSNWQGKLDAQRYRLANIGVRVTW